MTGNGGFLVALFAATGLHVAALGSISLPSGSEGSGSGGTESLSLAAVGAEVAALVEAWESQPEISETPDTMAAPDMLNAPEVVASADAQPQPQLPPSLLATEAPVSHVAKAQVSATQLSAPSLEAAPKTVASLDKLAPPRKQTALRQPTVVEAPRFDTEAPDVPDFAVTTSKRPTSRPPKPSAKAVAMVASGKSEGVTRGASTTSVAPTQTSAKVQAAAQAAWAAAIQREIAQAQVYPRGARGAGRVRLAMTITASGKLAGVQVAASSGVSAFDKAAVRAAKRAAPFPRAPSELEKSSFAFGQWVTFQR